MSERPLKVALLGCGVVGSEVARLMTTTGPDLAARIGSSVELSGIAVRRPARARNLPVDPALFTTDARELAAPPAGRWGPEAPPLSTAEVGGAADIDLGTVGRGRTRRSGPAGSARSGCPCAPPA